MFFRLLQTELLEIYPFLAKLDHFVCDNFDSNEFERLYACWPDQVLLFDPLKKLVFRGRHRADGGRDTSFIRQAIDEGWLQKINV